ncbi:MAG: D-alanyl-D-alanine carboxypeptidase family protein [Lachnospiraceae bacterium]|nr:D-alanyl-D-alanine carboxypeptidase family protein [Lachnospiraceae bacterium]
MQHRFFFKWNRIYAAAMCAVLIMGSLLAAPASAFAEEAAGEAVEAPAAENAEAAPAPAEPTAPMRDPLTNHLTNWPLMSEINEDSAVLMDADNGAILYSLDRDVQRIPASITKILTCLLVIENTQMDEIVTMTEAGMSEAYAGSSNISPVLGEQFTVEQCLYMLMLKSANDVAAQLAEYVGGSVDAFVQMMNDRCAAIGTTGTHFSNPNGLPGDNHYTTAMDMALIMQECLKNDTFRQIISTQTYTVPPTNLTPTERTYENHCKLIVESDADHYYPYCIGGKTGYTDLAWRTFVTAAEKDGRTLICVTLHGPDKSDFTDHKNLFEYGFNSFHTDACEGEAEDGWELSGGVTIPNGFEVSALTRQETALDDGSVRIDYSYEGNPVGRVLKTKKQEAKAAVQPSIDSNAASNDISNDINAPDEAMDAASQTIAAYEAKAEKKGDHLFGILIALLVVLILALIGVGYMLYLDRKRQMEEERRRKKREAKRRARNRTRKKRLPRE